MAILWSPSKQFIANSNMHKYQQFVEQKYGLQFASYDELWQWSSTSISDFWESLAEFYQIKFRHPYTEVLVQSDKMYNSIWFKDGQVSYAEHIFNKREPNHPAIVYQCEDAQEQIITWANLKDQVAAFQHFLISQNLQKGDRVVGFLPNCPEAIIAFLACNALGIIWSCCSPDFGTESVIERFEQISPKLLIAAKQYRYNGKVYDVLPHVQAIVQHLPSLQCKILIDNETQPGFVSWENALAYKKHKLYFVALDFNDPIWILYSSGTTGKPKAIVHRTGGMLLEHLKALGLHQDLKANERYMWYSTTGWMMWNYALSSLLLGASLCIYNGAPNYPSLDRLWEFAERNQINHFGAGAAFYLACQKQGLNIKSKYQLQALRTLGATGSPLPAEAFQYLYTNVKKEMWLISLSGGTDVCSAFVGGNPLAPVRAGEIQCRMLGAAIAAWDDYGKPLKQETGELMICKPMPCMPIYFWNDINFEKYRQAYFQKNENVWQHGDWIKITASQGLIIYGRSDATLNRDGVRIGTAEVYNAVEQLDEVKDSLVLCLEKKDGTFFMPLLVVLNNDLELNETIDAKIKQQLRRMYSPRHVPDKIYQVQEIPYTLSGKKMEMPIKKILMGADSKQSIALDAMRNPACVVEYTKLALEINNEIKTKA